MAYANPIQSYTTCCDDPEIVFAILPFCQLSPALDASTIATTLRREGQRAKVVYFNRIFASQIDRNFYDFAAAEISLNTLLGDWVFRDQVFGKMDDRGYLKSLLDRNYITLEVIPEALRAKTIAGSFLTECLNAIDWTKVKVMCLVETFAKRDAVSGQLMASLALAKVVKQRFPHVRNVLAGPSTEEEMGKALIELPFLDFVCFRDINVTVPYMITRILSNREGRIGDCAIPQSAVDSVDFGTPHTDSSLDLPIPDFDDYFSLRGDGLPGCFESLPMETSKGCWWAQSKHCVFCGLPGRQVRFRSKPPEKALLEIQMQVERYRPKRIEMNDLIIDSEYFSTLFPALGALALPVEIFYETKSHLKREQLEMLAKAGVRQIQAGLESLSANTLRQISKGSSPSQNVRFLQDCYDLGIRCYWNYLHSFPGETPSQMLAAIPVIESLTEAQPPATFQPVRVERFSPYFKDPARHGIESVRPDRSYHFLYAESGVDIGKVAFYFEHEEPRIDQYYRNSAVAILKKSIRDWVLRSGHSLSECVWYS